MKQITGKLRLDMKRMQMPGTFVPIKCPKCGTVTQVEIIDQIEYPGDEDESHTIGMQCCVCDAEVECDVDIVSVVVTLNVHEPLQN
jgi:phage FluMu protein Com